MAKKYPTRVNTFNADKDEGGAFQATEEFSRVNTFNADKVEDAGLLYAKKLPDVS